MTARATRNIALYPWYAIFGEPLFWGPILIHYLETTAYMTLSDIYRMESVALIVLFFLDVIFGSLADQIGYRKTILWGRGLLIAQMVGNCFLTAPWMAWATNFIWVAGFALANGADQSLLYESAKVTGQAERATRVMARAMGLRYLIFAAACALTGYLATVNLRLPVVMSLPFMLVPFVTALLFADVVPSKKYDRSEHWRLLLRGCKFVRQNFAVFWIIIFSTVLVVASKLWFFAYNDYFKVVGVPMQHWGLIFAGLNLVACVSSMLTTRVVGRLGFRWGMALCAASIVLPILAMGLYPHPAMAWMVLLPNIHRGLMGPLKFAYLQKLLETETRSTVASIDTASDWIFSALGLWIFSVVTATHAVPVSFVGLGLVTGFCVLCLMIVRPRVA